MATKITNKQKLAIEQPHIEIPDVTGTISGWIKKVLNALIPSGKSHGLVNEAQNQMEVHKANAAMQLMNLNR